MQEFGGWIAIGLPIVFGVVTALVLTWYAVRKNSDRWPGA